MDNQLRLVLDRLHAEGIAITDDVIFFVESVMELDEIYPTTPSRIEKCIGIEIKKIADRRAKENKQSLWSVIRKCFFGEIGTLL